MRRNAKLFVIIGSWPYFLPGLDIRLLVGWFIPVAPIWSIGHP
jgi:hypothetical protein